MDSSGLSVIVLPLNRNLFVEEGRNMVRKVDILNKNKFNMYMENNPFTNLTLLFSKTSLMKFGQYINFFIYVFQTFSYNF